MTAMEADVLKMLSKIMEAAEAPMMTETREGSLKTVEEAHKSLDMVSEELKLMEYEARNILSIAKVVTFEATPKFWGMED